jgi:hypothetical protein
MIWISRDILNIKEGYTLWNSHGKSREAMVPSLRVKPQWSRQMRLILIKGWKGGKRKGGFVEGGVAR